MLNDIMDRSMANPQKEPNEKPEPEQPPQEDPPAGEQTAPPPLPTEKNKPSSAYTYLAVLFGAAFLMLLLAYFVQQRNNAAIRDDLRTTTASREELLAEIKELEEKRDWLQNAYDLQLERNHQVDQQNQGLQEAVDRYYGDFVRIYTQYENARTLDYLEQFIHSRDYLMAAAVVANRNLMFDPNYSEPGESQQCTTPAQRAQYLDLRAELFRSSDLLVLAQEGNESGFPAGMLCVNTDSAMGRDELDTAGYLWSIVLYYAANPDWSAQLLANHYHSLTQNSGLFKPSTMELLEEIKRDLIAQDLLAEQNGELTLVNPQTLYGPGPEYGNDTGDPDDP